MSTATVSRRILLLALTLLAGTGGAAIAHETGAIYLASKQVPIGGDLSLSGERLPKNAVLQLQLRGALDNYQIGQIRSDAAGKVQTRVTLPPHVPVGNYTLVAIAPDGDVTARTDLVITPEPTAMAGMAGMTGGTAMPHDAQQMSGPHATAEMMALERRTSPAEWAVIAAIIAGCLGGGLVLLRKAARLAADEGGTAAGTPLRPA